MLSLLLSLKSRCQQRHTSPEGRSTFWMARGVDVGLCLHLHWPFFATSPLLIKTSVTGFGAHTKSTMIFISRSLTNYICKDPISKWGHRTPHSPFKIYSFGFRSTLFQTPLLTDLPRKDFLWMCLGLFTWELQQTRSPGGSQKMKVRHRADGNEGIEYKF